jgi:hypothetical protein
MRVQAQRVNRFADPGLAKVRTELSERLRVHTERPGERAARGGARGARGVGGPRLRTHE